MPEAEAHEKFWNNCAKSGDWWRVINQSLLFHVPQAQNVVASIERYYRKGSFANLTVLEQPLLKVFRKRGAPGSGNSFIPRDMLSGKHADVFAFRVYSAIRSDAKRKILAKSEKQLSFGTVNSLWDFCKIMNVDSITFLFFIIWSIYVSCNIIYICVTFGLINS